MGEGRLGPELLTGGCSDTTPHVCDMYFNCEARVLNVQTVNARKNPN